MTLMNIWIHVAMNVLILHLKKLFIDSSRHQTGVTLRHEPSRNVTRNFPQALPAPARWEPAGSPLGARWEPVGMPLAARWEPCGARYSLNNFEVTVDTRTS
jgi:hypothetical protein